MDNNQWRVFGIVVASLALHLSVSEHARTLWGDLKSGAWDAVGPDLAAQGYVLGAYAIGLVLLLMLTEAAPGIATLIAVILLVTVVLGNAQKIMKWVGIAQAQGGG